MEKELNEGQYLAAGVKEVPIPFTQDPTLKGDKEDLNKDSEILKGGELRDQVETDQDEANGKQDKKKKKLAFGGGAEGSEGGSGMAESYKEFKVGDTVCLNNIKNKGWLIESIQLVEDTAKFALRAGHRRMVVRPEEMIIEHIEGVEIHRERFEDSVNDLRRIYENMEMSTVEDGATPEVAPPEIMPTEAPVMEKKALYASIKEQGLHTCGDRGMALQKLGETCGNAMEEIHSVYEDACLSVHNENIDAAYDYAGADEYNENNAGLMSDLTAAYEQMAQKEIEETAKLTDEEGDRTGSKGGLNPVSLGF